MCSFSPRQLSPEPLNQLEASLNKSVDSIMSSDESEDEIGVNSSALAKMKRKKSRPILSDDDSDNDKTSIR